MYPWISRTLDFRLHFFEKCAAYTWTFMVKKQGQIGNLQQVEAVEESLNKSDWPMFTKVGSR